MKIETKFDVGQTVWIMFNNEPEQWQVAEIDISPITRSTPPMPLYLLRHIGQNHTGSVHEIKKFEYQVHGTRRELCLSFLNEND